MLTISETAPPDTSTLTPEAAISEMMVSRNFSSPAENPVSCSAVVNRTVPATNTISFSAHCFHEHHIQRLTLGLSLVGVNARCKHGHLRVFDVANVALGGASNNVALDKGGFYNTTSNNFDRANCKRERKWMKLAM